MLSSPRHVVWRVHQSADPRAAPWAQVAQGCLEKAKDLAGLLLLHSATGSGQGMAALQQAASAEGKHNVEFLAAFLRGQVAQCVDILIASGRLPEAAFFARTYLPSRTSEARPCTPRLPAGELAFFTDSATCCTPSMNIQRCQ